MKRRLKCIFCGILLKGKQKKYCSTSCKSHVLQSYPAQKKRGIKRKLQLVRSLGGCCSVCGYRQNLSALVFHHQGNDKEFKLDMRSLSNRTLEKVLVEVKKCRLVCCNCHAELHNPNLDLNDQSLSRSL